MKKMKIGQLGKKSWIRQLSNFLARIMAIPKTRNLEHPQCKEWQKNGLTPSESGNRRSMHVPINGVLRCAFPTSGVISGQTWGGGLDKRIVGGNEPTLSASHQAVFADKGSQAWESLLGKRTEGVCRLPLGGYHIETIKLHKTWIWMYWKILDPR